MSRLDGMNVAQSELRPRGSTAGRTTGKGVSRDMHPRCEFNEPGRCHSHSSFAECWIDASSSVAARVKLREAVGVSGRLGRSLDGRRRARTATGCALSGGKPNQEGRPGSVGPFSDDSIETAITRAEGAYSMTLNQSRMRHLGQRWRLGEAKVSWSRRVELRRAPRPTPVVDKSVRERIAIGSAHPAERRGGCRPLRRVPRDERRAYCDHRSHQG